MDFHQLLQEQIKVHLTRDISENSDFESFLKAINDSYLTFEKNTGNRYFQERGKINSIRKQQAGGWADVLRKITIKEDNRNLAVESISNSKTNNQKESENASFRTIGLLRILLDSIQSGILIEDENRKVLFVNQKFCEMFSIEDDPDNLTGIDSIIIEERCKSVFKKQDIFISRNKEIIAESKRTPNELLETITEGFLQREYLPVIIGGE